MGAPRVQVLRGVTPDAADLGTVRARVARHLVVDPRLVEEATDDGYRVGYDAGFTASLTDAADAIDSRERARSESTARAIATLDEASDQLTEVHQLVIAEIEDKIIEIAFEIARELLGRELAEPEGRCRDALRRALQLAPSGKAVVARMHPDDVARQPNDDAAASLDQILGGRSLTLIADPTLAPGDCVVDIDATRIDARIAPALDRIREVIWG